MVHFVHNFPINYTIFRLYFYNVVGFVQKCLEINPYDSKKADIIDRVLPVTKQHNVAK